MKVGLICEKGGRAYNQDYADYAVADGYICVAVADGLGSYDGSEAASEAAVKTVMRGFRRAVRRGDDLFSGTAVNKLFKNAHNAIHKLKNASPELSLGCTTLSVVIAKDGRLICAHVGDTRVYFFKDNVTEFYSKDHSLARLAADRGEITYAQIRTHKDQNKLTRVIGGDYFAPADYKIYNGYTEKDSVLVCSDGFWEYIYEEDVEAGLSVSDSAGLVLSALHKLHSRRAPDDCDNYSAILLRLSDSSNPDKITKTQGDVPSQNDISDTTSDTDENENSDENTDETSTDISEEGNADKEING